jgi:hypothetical protein
MRYGEVGVRYGEVGIRYGEVGVRYGEVGMSRNGRVVSTDHPMWDWR